MLYCKLSVDSQGGFLHCSVDSGPGSSVDIYGTKLHYVVFREVVYNMSIVGEGSTVSGPFFHYSSMTRYSGISLVVAFRRARGDVTVLSYRVSFTPGSKRGVAIQPFGAPATSTLGRPYVPPMTDRVGSNVW